LKWGGGKGGEAGGRSKKEGVESRGYGWVSTQKKAKNTAGSPKKGKVEGGRVDRGGG